MEIFLKASYDNHRILDGYRRTKPENRYLKTKNQKSILPALHLVLHKIVGLLSDPTRLKREFQFSFKVVPQFFFGGLPIQNSLFTFCETPLRFLNHLFMPSR